MKRRRKYNKIVKEALGSLSIFFFFNGLLYLFIYFDGGQRSVLMRNLKTVLLNQCHHSQGTFWTFVGVILLSQW